MKSPVMISNSARSMTGNKAEFGPEEFDWWPGGPLACWCPVSKNGAAVNTTYLPPADAARHGHDTQGQHLRPWWHPVTAGRWIGGKPGPGRRPTTATVTVQLRPAR